MKVSIDFIEYKCEWRKFGPYATPVIYTEQRIKRLRFFSYRYEFEWVQWSDNDFMKGATCTNYLGFVDQALPHEMEAWYTGAIRKQIQYYNTWGKEGI